MKTDEIDAARDRWVAALDHSDICRLASSFRGGDPCTIFRPRQHGSFNLCFFVEFESPWQRWVVRVPIPSASPRLCWTKRLKSKWPPCGKGLSLLSPRRVCSGFLSRFLLLPGKSWAEHEIGTCRPKRPSPCPKCTPTHSQTRRRTGCPISSWTT